MPGSVIVGGARPPIGKLSSSLKKSFLGPEAKWLPIPEVYLPGSSELPGHILKETVSGGFDPALSYDLKLDRGFMTVYYELESMASLPMVPIILNCATTTPPLMTLRHAYDFGAAVGGAIPSFDGLKWVAVIASDGLSHFHGELRVGGVGGVGGVDGVDEVFDRWFLRRLESQDYDEVLFAPPNDELMEAGNGTGEVRPWMADAEAMRGAMRGATAEVLADEPIYPCIYGMGVVLFDRATV